MNLMGMGIAEIAVVMVVAFLVLGPSRAITLARTAGKLLGDLRRTFNDVASAITLEEQGEERKKAESPQVGTPWESRPVPQPEAAQADSVPDSTSNGLRPENPEPEDDSGPAPAKNGDE